jgi:hypothetical protein
VNPALLNNYIGRHVTVYLTGNSKPFEGWLREVGGTHDNVVSITSGEPQPEKRSDGTRIPQKEVQIFFLKIDDICGLEVKGTWPPIGPAKK